MSLTLGSVFGSTGIDTSRALVIRHAYVREHEDGTPGIHGDSTASEVMEYTRVQSTNPRIFPASPPALWVVFLPEGGSRARLWSVVTNRGEVERRHDTRTFDLVHSEVMADLRDRLVIEWPSPRTWRLSASTAQAYSVVEIADAQPVPFPGFDALVLDHPQLLAVVREHRYASWRTALSSLIGIYLITYTRDGRHYIGKADGSENLLQRWSSYARNGHGGNVELRSLDPSSFRFSVLRIFDPTSPPAVVNRAEGHYKTALDTRRHGLNRN